MVGIEFNGGRLFHHFALIISQTIGERFRHSKPYQFMYRIVCTSRFVGRNSLALLQTFWCHTPLRFRACEFHHIAWVSYLYKALAPGRVSCFVKVSCVIRDMQSIGFNVSALARFLSLTKNELCKSFMPPRSSIDLILQIFSIHGGCAL